MKICVVGTGYQGLVVGTCLAENGHLVTCVDLDASRIRALQAGELPIYEPGLDELVSRNVEEERLGFSLSLEEALFGRTMVFFCVGTPTDDTGATDIAQVEDAVRTVAQTMDAYRILVLKSTCPPGTADRLEAVARDVTTQPFDLVVNPDFIKEGAAVDDFLRPDRVVIGCDDVRVREIMRELYGPFLRTGKPFLAMDRRSAEMVKYATNSMVAARISLMNQLADLCSAYDADVSQVREALSADDRIGSTFLFPGIGFGGAGLPKDLATCIKLAKDGGVDHDFFDAIVGINRRRRSQFLARILSFYGDRIAGCRIAVWGAAFKPRTDDIRAAPALDIIDGLLEAGASIAVYDPAAGKRVRAHYGDRVTVVPKYYHALEGAHGLAIITEWNEFRRPDYERMGELMAEKVIFDGRNLYTPSVMQTNGFRYFSVGRPDV